MVALPGLEVRAKRLSFQQPLIPCERGSVAGQSCPVRHITLWSSPLAVLRAKNTARNRNRTEVAAQRALLSLPSRSIAFPSTETEKSQGEEERLCPRGRGSAKSAGMHSAMYSNIPVTCHTDLHSPRATSCSLQQPVWPGRSLVQALETAPFLRRSSEMWAATRLSALSASLQSRPSQELQLLWCSSLQAVEIEQLDSQSHAMNTVTQLLLALCFQLQCSCQPQPHRLRAGQAGWAGVHSHHLSSSQAVLNNSCSLPERHN